MDSRALLTANAELLRQMLQLVPELSDENYRSLPATCMEGSIGQHLRHVIDHYQCFVDGLQRELLDYSARGRNVQLECDPEFARETTSRLADTLEALDISGSSTLMVLHEPVNGNSEPAVSSVARELEFLLSHTIHHYALIAIALRLLGISVPENFGLAFSTVNFRSESAAQTIG